ncbi:unnamed protein product [Aphanomyces euteiches]|uniref:Regulator of microtubule dynamics protein 1 n=1 Tax=Aphanomyces euteiches TaxID=100861 RepID=A0A6G0XV77_9STRA|nr:hypothetical protein Ae201684_000844 [Aphanomyces euteiches]KAH9100064.1 hypothetical protein Ae201684P_019067 [Aphanomyces euteiches]
MSWERSAIYIAAAFGLATGAVLVYRYATSGLGGDRPVDEEEIPDVTTTTATSGPQSSSTPRAIAVETTTRSIAAEASLTPLPTNEELEMNRLVVQEGNMLLSLFGLAFLAIVAVVAVVVAMANQSIDSALNNEMFPPLVFIGLGILAASFVHSTNQRNLISPLPAIISEKGVPFHEMEELDTVQKSPRGPSSDLPNASDIPPVPQRSPSSHQPRAPASAPTEKPSLDKLISRADELYTNTQYKEIKTFLDVNLPHYPTDVDLLWRSARACQDLSSETSDEEAKKALVFEGMTYAERAYDANPNDAMANKWMGIMISSCGNYRDTSEKIKGAYKIKNFISRAIELNPTDATSHNILGQWCLAFANLSWLEKQAATMLFGRPPQASYDDAVRHFHDAENISPGFWKKNTYLLGETYAKMKNFQEAKLWLTKAHQIPIKTAEDKEVQGQIETLLAKL